MSPKARNARKATQAASEANELKRAGALNAGARRTSAFRDKLTHAMDAIEREVIANKGMYLPNEGRLNPTEIARRAGVVFNSLYHPRHEELKNEVDVFVERMLLLAPSKVVDQKPPERTWEELYHEMATNYRADGLEWQSDRAQREAAEKRVAELEQSVAGHLETIEHLTHQLAALTEGRVVPIGSKKGAH